MYRKIFIISFILSFIAITACQVLAQYGASPLTEIITISNGPVADKPSVNISIFNTGSHIVTFLNNTGVQINVNDTTGGPDKDGPGGRNVPASGRTDYYFNCPADAGLWTFIITQDTTHVTVTVNVACVTAPPGVPTLTQWGMLILVVLILVAGVYLWMRRKPVPS